MLCSRFSLYSFGFALGVGLASITAMLGGLREANAAYDRQVTWEDMSALDLRAVFRSDYSSPANMMEPAIPPSAFDLALRDADAKVSADFRVPTEMRELVGFWLRIYTEFTTQHVVLFDTRHPEAIYEVLDFRALSKRARNRAAYEIMMDRKIKKTVAEYKAGFQRLARNKNPRKPTDTEKKILAAYAKMKHKHRFAELASTLRVQAGQRDNIMKGLLAAEAFFPKMEQIFREYQVPVDITRLALVESSFNPSAYSKAGAAGVWQFMRRSADEYMLVSEPHGIDERLSPLKSTVAAAKLLKRNHRVFKNWSLAITAYNHGLRTFLKLPQNKRTFALFDPCSKKSPLKFASRNYYAEFLAVVHAEAYRQLFYGKPPVIEPKHVVFHQLSRPQTAMAFAKRNRISPQDFHILNPDIKNLGKLLPAGFWVAMTGESDDMAGLFIRKRAREKTQLIAAR